MLEDGTEANVPISGTIKFKGRSNTKADRANCMCADDVIVIRGSFASAKVSPAAAAFIRKHYEAKGIKTPRGFFSSAVEEEEEKQMGGNVGGGGGFEFDRDDELAGEEAEVAALRAENARTIALRTGKAVSVDSEEDSDIDILVAYSQPPDSDQYFGTQFYLEDLLGRPVDLVTETALRERLRPYVERDAIAI